MTRKLLFVLVGAISIIVIAICGVTMSRAQSNNLRTKDARKLIARFAGIELPTDAIEVERESISVLGSSAVVEAKIRTAFRFAKTENGEWRVAEVRTGPNRWENIEQLQQCVNREKTARARAELEQMHMALAEFRRTRGSYVAAKDHATLIDYLYPRYLPRALRFDPWHRPYEYQGTTNAYLLRSLGADGVAETNDDVVVSPRSKV